MRFWCVSPNANADRNDLPEWKAIIEKTGRVFLGRSSDDGNGSTFKNSVKKDDLILVAQGSNANKEVLIAGIVDSDASDEFIEGAPDWAQNRKLKWVINPSELKALPLVFDSTCAFGDSSQPHAIFELKLSNPGDKRNIEILLKAIEQRKNNMIVQNSINLLKTIKPQIILQGPPGTGKTRRAQEIAYQLVTGEVLPEDEIQRKGKLLEFEASPQYKFVQFHPAYSYEDFVRGIVAQPVKDGISYQSKDQLFTDLCVKAGRINTCFSSKEKTIEYIYEKIDLFLDYISKNIVDGKYDLGNSVYVIRCKPKTLYWWKVGLTANRDLENGASLDVIRDYVIWKKFNLYSEEPIRKRHHDNYLDEFVDSFEKWLGLKLPDRNDPLIPLIPRYILIIDEINRANLPSVLGELIYGLEYRGRKVDSLYSVDDDAGLVIPENLYIIGTMNTADRSVGHIDYAIRRRFAFMDVLPTNQPIVLDAAKELFRNVASIFISNYDSISDWSQPVFKPNRTHLAIDFKPESVMLGHSYFLAKTVEELRMKLEYEIKPLLREYVQDGILNESASAYIDALPLTPNGNQNTSIS